MGDFALSAEASALVVRAAGIDVARYVFADDAPAFEGPKPYLHPVRSLSGAPLTGFRPWDHRWHRGLQVTLTDVSGQNFWGGDTYVHGRGYLPLDNVGRIRHDRFTTTSDGEEAVVEEELTWITRAGEAWLGERRALRFHTLDEERGLWALDVVTTLRGTGDRELVLGSPTTNGREDAGYSGVFLRLPRSFSGGTVTVPEAAGAVARTGAAADAVMGAEAPWLAFAGLHDEVDGGGTVLAFAGRSSGHPAVRWFVRSEPIPVLAPSPTFAETIALRPGDELSLAHRFVFLDRVRETDELVALADELAPC
ncbi:PmoA family protein [Microbacterium betulae]|uniref:PmoA family protein n=1 Tax=Microbacterium betulae TaxID=2981139 RepID=A0AA97FJN3_9MICO|nr:PmoA family protein [Microbacterium sp. AB]WOF24295.1 PmoA family protein [Microbacterium sp. AB]